MDRTQHAVNHHDLLQQHIRKHEDDLNSGKYAPYLLHWSIAPFLLVFFYLLVPHRNHASSWVWRRLIFLIVAATAIHQIRYVRTSSISLSYGIGMQSFLSVLSAASILLCNDPQEQLYRIAYTRTERDSGLQNSTSKEEQEHISGERLSFVWQRYPAHSLKERIKWIADLTLAVRGVGWNWQIPGLGTPPAWVRKQLKEKAGKDEAIPRNLLSRVRVRWSESRTLLIKRTTRTILTNYVILDGLKVMMMRDPYFLGISDPSPPPFMPAIVCQSPVLLQAYRLIATLTAMYAVIQTILDTGPFLYAGVLGPKLAGSWGELWMNPDSFGSFTAVLDRGLRGWWGDWWHQTFRFVFETPADALIRAFSIDVASRRTRLVKLGVAFSLSGLLHACGSYTTLPHTMPFKSFLFFILQPLGITVETYLVDFLDRSGVSRTAWQRRALNFCLVHLWLFYTGSLLCDDLASSAVWLVEPVPFSPLRALGLGVEGDQAWCWGGSWISWHQGGSWWQSGWKM